jgi:uncharacterized iron-regulated membrane protein
MTVEDAGAVAEAVRVTVALQVGLQGLFENTEAVTPLGRAVRMLKVTGVVVAPVASVAVAVSTPPAAPSVIDSVDGLAARVKSKKPETTRVNVVVWVRTGEPPVAWMVMTVVDAGAVADAVKVTVALHVGLQGLFENTEAVTPLGNAVRMLKVTGAVVAPVDNVAVAVSIAPAAPSVIDKVDGLTASVKSKKPETTRVKVAVWVRTGEPPVAWIVMTVEDAGAVAEAVRVTVALHVGLQGLLVNADAVTPLGRAVRILKVTGDVVALALSVAVAVSTPPAAPSVIDRVDGLAARVKSKKPETTRVKVAV